MQGAGEGFDEYERLRNLGYSKEEALKRAMLYSGVSAAGNKFDDIMWKKGIPIDYSDYAKYNKKGGKSATNKPLQNSAGYYIIEVKDVDVFDEPNRITQKVNEKGGIDRNFYDENGYQVKQISNNGHGHAVEEAMGQHGEHAHDYELNEAGVPEYKEARELTYWERKENEDFL